MIAVDLSKHTFKAPRYRSVVAEALAFFGGTPVHTLPPPEQFSGAGVYALYYIGSLSFYASVPGLTDKSCVHPIYVGKAVSPGWRTGRATNDSGANLYGRLDEHYRSIGYAANLKATDFRCRFMLLKEEEGDLVVPCEAELIRTHRPLWNSTISGFGIHTPGKGRFGQQPSEWDVLHPGRPWVSKLTGEVRRKAAILAKIRAVASATLS